MAIQILGQSPAEQYKQTAGQELGSALGQGLQMLAQQKLQDVMGQRQKASALQGLQALGFNPQEAQQLSGLDPFIQREIVKQKMAAPQQQAYAQALQGLLGGQPQESLSQEEQPQQQPSMQVSDKVEMREGPVTEEAKVKTRVPDPGGVTKGLSFLNSGGFNQQQATELAKLALKKEQATKGEIAERYKETRPYREKILDSAKAARSDLKDLNRMEELEKEGKLDTPGYVEFLKRSGMDIPALMNPGSEEFQKISTNFLRNAKQYFGSRVSNYEIEQFLKTIPSLSQSPEGRKRVIANLKSLSRGALEYNDAMKEVIAENSGIPPFDLREKVDDKIEKRMDKIASMFKKDLERPVPEGQNKLITALQSSLGSIIGAPGKLLGKVSGSGGGSEAISTAAEML